MPASSLSFSEAARFPDIPEEEARKLSDAEGRVSLEVIRSRAGAATIARELAGAREEVGRLSGQLGEIRASNVRLQKELKDSLEERRRLTEEVLELRAAAEERRMLMERIEHIAHIEQTLAEYEAELERLRNRKLLERLLNR